MIGILKLKKIKMQLSSKEKKRLLNKYGKWAIVTGASSGIGLELATQLASAGFNLIINARSNELLQQVSRKLEEQFNIQAVPVQADLSEPEGIEKIILQSKSIDIGLLINNAGYGTSGLFTSSSLHTEINMLRVNCEAVLSLTHYFAQKFKEQKRGGIIFLSSLVAFQGVPYAANYAASKAYIQSFAEALFEELKPFNVDVLAASPGPVNSNFEERANMRMGKALSPSQIGVPVLASLGRQSNVVPGTLSKILVYSLRTVPRFVKIKIMKKVMGKFVRHQLQ